MTSGVWEPLAELELNLCEPSNSQIYCLCSRAIFRSRIRYHSLEDFKEKSIDNVPTEAFLEANNEDFNLEFHSSTKQESEAASCYCSASHYSTDDYESANQAATEHQTSFPQQSSLQNSDSGADLSEYFVEKLCTKNSDLSYKYSKPKIETAWEKYWSENGENIIWKSWIEKYGAYINPNYLEQNLVEESNEKPSNDDNAEDNLCSKNEANVKSQTFNKQDEECCVFESVDCDKDVNFDRIPDLKISSYPSFGSLLEGKNESKPVSCLEDSDSEDKILKSNSFGSYSSYEKVKWLNNFSEKLKSVENERVKSRCSNTNLSVKSIANTTVTTDSMTNVTKITLSSLDLSCDNDSVKSSSLFSTSSDESSRLPSSSSSSSSTSSSSKELCTEADLWWKQVWKEHYEDQYEISYQDFIVNYSEAEEGIENLLIGNTNKSLNLPHQAFESSEKKNSVSHILKKLSKAILEPENNLRNITMDESQSLETCETSQDSPSKSESLKRQLEDYNSCDMGDELKTKSRKKVSPRKSQNKKNSDKKEQLGKTDKIKQALSLMGFSFKEDFSGITSGTVTYRKKNIRGQSRRLKLWDTKPKMHIFFDDEGKPFEEKKTEDSDEAPLPLEDTDSTEQNQFVEPQNLNLIEPESLGYEAHSSSVEDCETAYLNKKQKKKRRKLKKCNNIPQEILENKRLLKYWFRRYELFSKFDYGIKLDLESWFSVTPEKLAQHHAERCRCDVIIDAFCGAGGNSIQFAFTCERVIAIDIDPLKIEMAKHNAKIYGVDDRIEFVVGDFLSLASKLHADVIFLSPPWGGPEYSSHEVYDLKNILPPLGGEGLFNLASTVAEHVAFFLPKNIDSKNLALLCGPGGEVEIEQNIVGRRAISVTAYFGGLVMDPEDPYIEVS